MNTEKNRFLLFIVLAVISFWGMTELTKRLGLNPPPPKRNAIAGKPAEAEKGKAKDLPAGVAKDAEKTPAPAAGTDKDAKPAVAQDAEKNAKAPELDVPKIAVVPPAEMVLGSTDKKSGYHLRVQLSQKGAGVDTLASALFDAERVEGQKEAPLELIQRDKNARHPLSFAMTLRRNEDVGKNAAKDDEDADPAAAAELVIGPPAVSLDAMPWEVVKDGKNPAVRATPKGDGQEIQFRATTPGPKPVTVTKTYRLFKGQDAFEMELAFSSPHDQQEIVYELMGPHNLPIEGEWYTGTFREFFTVQGGGNSSSVSTQTALDVVKAVANPERYQKLPLKFVGVENQYFTVFLKPDPLPRGNEDKWDAETRATVIGLDAVDKQKSDISFIVTSRPITVGPNRDSKQKFVVYAGAKRADDLKPFGAEVLASYRKNTWFFIPGASYMAQYVIAPMLDRTYALTKGVAKIFGGTRGSYGIAIILLTVLVRLCLFPLGRKMALSAQKMQQLSPLLKEIQEKYKDDKERATKETFALYKQHKVNPVGGCLPALIQMPILVGLWQALNNSVALRHAPFLWIDNLAAPDMLFNMHIEVPWIGHWFNLLPLGVVGLMLVQTKLFSPPATTPEAEMQQKMMKYMMVVMAVMFYKVPSGLGIYFITSSLWQICERLLLPKPAKVAAAAAAKASAAEDLDAGSGNGKHSPKKPPSPKNGDQPKGFLDGLKERLEKIMEEARHDKTLRNNTSPVSKDDGRDRSRPRPRPEKRR
jgi:YidC/Oxa1 family membrane protein insertase